MWFILLRCVCEEANKYPSNTTMFITNVIAATCFRPSSDCTRLHATTKYSATVYVYNIIKNWVTNFVTVIIFMSCKYRKLIQTPVIYDVLSRYVLVLSSLPLIQLTLVAVFHNITYIIYFSPLYNLAQPGMTTRAETCGYNQIFNKQVYYLTDVYWSLEAQLHYSLIQS
jgi:hypothetical protein